MCPSDTCARWVRVLDVRYRNISIGPLGSNKVNSLGPPHTFSGKGRGEGDRHIATLIYQIQTEDCMQKERVKKEHKEKKVKKEGKESKSDRRQQKAERKEWRGQKREQIKLIRELRNQLRQDLDGSNYGHLEIV